MSNVPSLSEDLAPLFNRIGGFLQSGFEWLGDNMDNNFVRLGLALGGIAIGHGILSGNLGMPNFMNLGVQGLKIAGLAALGMVIWEALGNRGDLEGTMNNIGENISAVLGWFGIDLDSSPDLVTADTGAAPEQIQQQPAPGLNT